MIKKLNKELPIDQAIRYYMGRHKIIIIEKDKKKALIMHLEDGYVGNKDLGYKKVKNLDRDVVPMRILYKRKN